MVRLVWLHGDKVVGNDCEAVIVNRKFLDSLRAAIDETQLECLARMEAKLGQPSVGRARQARLRAVIVHLAVDEVVVARRGVGPARRHHIVGRHRLADQISIVVVIPVSEHDRAQVCHIIGVVRAIDHQRPVSPTSVLRRVVRVIPGGAIEVCAEIVRIGLTGSDGTLTNRGNTVEPGCLLL